MNQKVILEATTIEAQMAELEAALLGPADRRP
jgi:hypothetical protein